MENPPPGAVVGAIATTGGTPGTALVWTLTSDNGAGGRFVVNASTGVVSVSPANTLEINFEGINVFTLNVQAALASAPTVFSAGVVTVRLINVNEPPAYTQALSLANDTSVCVAGRRGRRGWRT